MIRDIEEKDFSETIASGTVLADFWALWCSYCKVIGAVLEQ
ncbi:MAG: thioredoxin, partial [Lentisphaeria bacterium]|nr:thioredoxin [Lentisphaeria bacterium]